MNSQVSFTCSFSTPRRYDGSPPDNYGNQWQYASETCSYNTSMFAPTTSISSSTNIAVYGSMTAGEVFIILLTFVIIIIELTKILTRALDRIKTKKKYINYSNAEVEVKEEL